MKQGETSWWLSAGAVLGLLSWGCSSGDGSSPGTSAGGGSGVAGNAPISGAGTAGASAGASTGGGSGAAGSSGAATAGSSGAGGASGAGGTGGGGGASGNASAAGASGAGGGTPSPEKFSFFVTGMANLLALAKAKDPTAMVGFGGDLSYGEVGAGAGLRGADKICTALAEKGMPNNHKVWRAFLSVTAGEDGKAVNAIDRIGTGPWYDLAGRLVASNVAGLKNTRPTGGDAAIANDLPNELGVPNHQPNPNEPVVDNHDTMTGSNEDGELESTNKGATCNDWTSKVGNTGKPRIGHSWPRSGGTQSWIAEHMAGGCGPGVNINGQGGPAPGDLTVGAGGGYGGFYCFALTP